MADQQMDLDGDLVISGSEMASAIAPALLADSGFIRSLANNQQLIQLLAKNPIFIKAVSEQAASIAGQVIVKGLTR